jgi:triosephosphate isomerase
MKEWTMRTPMVAGNWKMNTTVAEATALVGALRAALAPVTGVDLLVCPPFVSLGAVSGALAGSGIAVGAQNMHPETKGAFTGEVSGPMLEGLATHVILGHSERRHLLGEDDAFVAAKVQAALGLGLTPVLCVGETLEQREAGHAEAVVAGQLAAGLAGLDTDAIGRVVVAYEPVWAIGTGRAATPEIAQAMMGAVRYELTRLSHIETAQSMPLLYGGSVNPANAAELAAQEDIDGALVGGASLVAEQFAAIATAFAARTAR